MTARFIALAALACAGLLAGCGEKEEITSAPAPAPGETSAAPAQTSTTPAPTDTEARPRTSKEEGGASPEDQEGGAGDEIPARSQALFTGRGGRISPRRVRVPPFIAVRVELRSADGARYRLRGGGKTLRAGGRLSSMGATFDGLRPGRRLTLSGAGGRAVVVEASAEPGP